MRRPETDAAEEVGVGIMSVRSKEMFMRFEKFTISSSLPGLLDRLRKCCAKVHCRFLAVYFVSEFEPWRGSNDDRQILPWCPLKEANTHLTEAIEPGKAGHADTALTHLNAVSPPPSSVGVYKQGGEKPLPVSA